MGDDGGTRSRLVDATIDAIDAGGEAAVRLRDVAAAVGIAQPSIYHFFATRERLIEAAQGVRWQRDMEPMVEFFRGALSSATNADEFLKAARATLHRVYRPDRWASRRKRFNVLAGVGARPELREVIAASQRRVDDAIAEIFRHAQERGWMRGDVDAVMFAAWTVGQVNGRIFVEIDADNYDLDAWDAISTDAVLAVIGQAPEGAVGVMSDVPEFDQPLAVVNDAVESVEPSGEGGTRERAIDAAIAIITSDGESALRMRDVADRVGVREPSLYHFFANRDDLVVATQAERWRRDQDVLFRVMEANSTGPQSRDEFLAAASMMFTYAFAPDRAAVRRNRVEILGAAQSRPALMDEIVKHERRLMELFASRVAIAQVNGWTRRNIDPAAFTAWFFGAINGRNFVELDPDNADFAAWDAIARRAAFSALGYPPGS